MKNNVEKIYDNFCFFSCTIKLFLQSIDPNLKQIYFHHSTHFFFPLFSSYIHIKTALHILISTRNILRYFFLHTSPLTCSLEISHEVIFSHDNIRSIFHLIFPFLLLYFFIFFFPFLYFFFLCSFSFSVYTHAMPTGA